MQISWLAHFTNREDLMSLVHPLRSEILDAIWPRLNLQTQKGQFLLSISAAALLALAAQVSLPLPMTPVPLCLAPQVVCWLAWNLPAIAPRAVALYLIGAGLQLPLLAIGKGGYLQLAGPRGGYLIGYFAAALLVGQYRRLRGARITWKSALLAQWMGSALILFFGSLRLAMFLGGERAWQLGVLPFLIGDFFIKAPLMSTLNVFARKSALRDLNTP